MIIVTQKPRESLDGDEGELEMKIGVVDGKILIAFAKPVTWIGMSAGDAVALSELLLKHAAELAAQKEG